jgi:hypothetical protein
MGARDQHGARWGATGGQIAGEMVAADLPTPTPAAGAALHTVGCTMQCTYLAVGGRLVEVGVCEMANLSGAANQPSHAEHGDEEEELGHGCVFGDER